MPTKVEKKIEEINQQIEKGQEPQPLVIPELENQKRIDIGEAIGQAILTLDKGDIFKFSYLTKEEETLFALWSSIAKEYNLDFINRFISSSLRMRVSIEGRGRNDIVKIASAHIEQTVNPPSIFSRMRTTIGI